LGTPAKLVVGRAHREQTFLSWGNQTGAWILNAAAFCARVRELGGAETFLPQAWQSGVLPSQPGAWSVPWSCFTFVLCYRRDLLAKADIPEATAFQNLPALAQTLEHLQAAGVECPWVVPVSSFHLGILHMVASFVWGMGGNFVSPTAHALRSTSRRLWKAFGLILICCVIFHPTPNGWMGCKLSASLPAGGRR
jgi:hypothetical protein